MSPKLSGKTALDHRSQRRDRLGSALALAGEGANLTHYCPAAGAFV